MKILVVEDDISTRKLEQLVLERSGHTVLEAEDGNSALRVLNTEKVELILLDLLMPGMSGIDLLERLKSNPDTSSIPVVLCTSVSEQDSIEKAVSFGINGCIMKPIVPKQMLQKLQQVVCKLA